MNVVFDLIVRIAAGVVIVFAVSLVTGLIFGRVIRQRDRQYPEVTDDEDAAAYAEFVDETRLGRQHDAQFTVWEQELRDKSKQRHPSGKTRDDGEAP